MSAPALIAREIEACYGASQILFGLNLEVDKGEIVALLGRNGAGKTTTFRALIGLLPLRRGQITLAGRRVDGMRTHAIAQLGVGYVPRGPPGFRASHGGGKPRNRRQARTGR